jgi:two-component system, cell cycle sensor histidine kinase and response regulator CckA
MKPAPQPNDETRRLEVLRQYNLPDTQPEQAIDDLAALAAHICRTPIALVCLIDGQQQWCKSRFGWSVSAVPRDLSICAYAMLGTGTFIVPDATQDERFADSPLVTGDPYIRFYAGAPLLTPAGEALGTLCVMDRVPRELSAAQLDALLMLSRQVMSQLELRRQTRELAASEARLFDVFRSAPIAMAIHRWSDGKFVDVNAAFTTLLGWTRDEVIGSTSAQMNIVDEATSTQLRSRLAGARFLRDTELTIKTRRGGIRDVVLSAELVELRGEQHAISTFVDITGRKQVEHALRAGEEGLRLALQAAQMGTFDWDVTHSRLTWSRGHEVVWGFAPGEFDGRRESFVQRVHPDDLPVIKAEVARCMAAREAFRCEFRVIRSDGSVRWLQGLGEFTYEAGGRPVRMRGVVLEATAHKQAEEALRTSERRLRNLIDGFGPSVFVGMLSPDGRLLEGNRSALLATGLEFGEVIGKRFDDLPPWTHSPQVRQQLREAIDRAARGEPSRYDVQIGGQQGELIDLDFSLQPIRDEAGKVAFLVPSATVITERKRAEEHVRQLNRVYAVLSEINQAIVRERSSQAVLDAVCRIAVEKGQFHMAWIGLVVPPAGQLKIAAHAGASPDTLQLVQSLLGGERPDCAFTFHALQRREHGVCNDIANDPQAAGWRDRALQRDYRSMASLPLIVRGSVIGTFNLYSGQPGLFDAEELRLLDELALDVSFSLEIHERDSERLRAEQALRESEQRFRQLAQSIQEVFWMTDAAGAEVLYISPAYEKIWGRPCASLYESPSAWLDAVHHDDRASVSEAMASLQVRGELDETYRIQRPDGTIRRIHARALAVRDAEGEVLRIVGTAEDITQRWQLEEQLRQAQKMDAIGQLAGGVAHDFNNILTVIQGYGSLLMMAEQTPEAADAVGQIVQAAERAANLTRQLLAFSRRQVMQRRLLDLNESVSGLGTLLQRILGEDVRLQLSLDARQLTTNADPGMIDQVLMNLVVNARDAMPNGGQLLIETSERLLTEDDAREIGASTAGRHVCLRVTDTGAGISPENLPHIFEPFFTTKAPGKGTGLGLATVFGIVAQHGGSLKVDSAVGTGTTFQVFLPAANATPSLLAEAVAELQSRGGSETILLVEDDPYVRALTRVVLERQGYRLLEASHGAEALRVWDQHAGAIDLLLTDIVMPEGVSGRELAARLQSRKPSLRVVFTSGYSPDIAGGELSLRERQSFIRKPSSPRHLLETVRRCLDTAVQDTVTINSTGNPPPVGESPASEHPANDEGTAHEGR